MSQPASQLESEGGAAAARGAIPPGHRKPAAMVTASFRAREYRAGDEHGILDLINLAFGADPNFQKRSLAWWRWKYGDNPHGACTLCLESPDGEIVGHYGGSMTRLRTRRGTFEVVQVCDACVHPGLRRGLQRVGLFVRMARTIAAVAHGRSIGAAYGLPTPDHFVLGARLAEYWMLRSQPILVCRRDDSLPDAPAAVRVDRVDSIPGDVGRLLASVARAIPVMADRSRAFLQWRFFGAPDRTYVVGVARSRVGGEIRGLAVYRSCCFLGRRTGVIVDWLVPPEDRDAGAALIHFAAKSGIADGLGELVCFLPPTSAWARAFQQWGFAFEPTNYAMVFRPLARTMDHDEIRRDWYYTLADLDAV